jgi:hypothetical protein
MVNPSDKTITVIVVLLIIVHLLIPVASIVHCSLITAIVLNLTFAVVFITYWIYKAVKINRYVLEDREKIVIGFELLVIATSLHLLITNNSYHFLNLLPFVIAVIHTIVLILFLILMLTFKIKRLF